jgi:hypothetical protein
METRQTRSMADHLLSTLPDSPDSYPQNLDLVRCCVLQIALDESAYRAASFLDDRILTPGTKGAWQPLERVIAMAQLVQNPRPLHYIFHTGHVGSTLLSRLLDDTGSVLSLREPLPLRTLAEASDSLGQPESLLSESQFDRVLDTLVRLWSRGYASTRCVVVKATSVAARVAPRLLQCRDTSLGVYLNLRAEPYLATLLAGQNSPADLRGHGAERMRRLRSHIETPVGPLHALSPGELAAMSWLAESLTRRELLDRFPARLLAVDFDALLADLPGEMQRITSHLHVPVGTDWLSRLSSNPALAHYSKSPDYDYSPALRSQLLNQARRDHRDEIGRGMRWLETLSRTEATVTRLLADEAT